VTTDPQRGGRPDAQTSPHVSTTQPTAIVSG